jgi:flagellar hook protein FlgE
MPDQRGVKRMNKKITWNQNTGVIFAIGAIQIFFYCGSLETGPISSIPPNPNSYNFLQGNLKITGRILDLAISGEGLFIMKKGQEFLYCRRPGSFFQDKDGYFVLAFNDIRLQGFSLLDTVTPQNLTLGGLSDIKIPITLKENPKATAKIWLACNLDHGAERADHSMTTTIYDNLGHGHTMTMQFKATQEPARWNWSITMTENEVLHHGTTGRIQFCSNGSPDTFVFNNPEPEFTFSPINTSDTVRITFEAGNRETFTGLTNFNSSTTATIREQDGYPEGRFQELSIDLSGEIWAVFSNGISRRLFQIPIARFPCKEGLELCGSNFLLETEYSGKPIILFPGNGFLSLNAGCIELDP